ncbi:10511_t:CDS:1, partial [Acaulospora morrowiae]
TYVGIEETLDVIAIPKSFVLWKYFAVIKQLNSRPFAWILNLWH